MTTLDHLNQVLQTLRTNAATIAFTLAGLVFIIYAIMILLDNDNSPQARTERWAKLKRVFVLTILIAAVGAIIQYAQSLGGQL